MTTLVNIVLNLVEQLTFSILLAIALLFTLTQKTNREIINIVLLVNNFLKKEKNSPKNPVPDGYCPNCWGRTEYGGKFYEAVHERKVDINKKDPEIGWIQDYAEKNLRAIIPSQKGAELVCPTCKISYKPAELT